MSSLLGFLNLLKNNSVLSVMVALSAMVLLLMTLCFRIVRLYFCGSLVMIGLSAMGLVIIEQTGFK